MRQNKKLQAAFKRMWLHFFLVDLRNGLKNAWIARMCKYALENFKRFHNHLSPDALSLLTNWHFTICNVFGSIEIYFGANEKEKKNPLCAVRKILEWIFKCSSSNTMAHGYGAVECCRSLDVSKCDSKPIHTIFNDFDSNKCDLKKKKVSETKISFSLTLAVCLMD